MEAKRGGCNGEMCAVMRRNRAVGAFIEIALHPAFSESELSAIKGGDEFAGNQDIASPCGFAVLFDAHGHNNRLKVGQLLYEAAVFSYFADLREINALGVDLEIHISRIALNGSDEEFKAAVRINGVVTLCALASEIILE